ncbi:MULTISPECIES: 2-dehydropantoate 2-reductase [unclassified Bosea (in: a-proteobacteria)]|uniref:2-dehydropantoate 2-reductase n=1 Tax=unclassified Bosea (in: a-proteobacteria) TaxID=2653178 RepID=UPI000F74CC00|nr:MULTISPECIES: 2-dehydropantoate 2-reductase [unclassified Bosea (in: a-proteobacteria)]AZO78273.1 2-dehydropantoate 2-reductase [Bosea sp. Tri-49]RXT20240.1 2-dehydropantoate 2-reductase [Bosea sp. Tri-39]RXT37112.1 2-dehydropantoate 2-reductase [Bosea sp. Tri-54]
MKICIYGAGAIGGYMGVMLKRGGLDISLVARGAHLEAINAKGLTLVTKTETITEQMPASRDPRDLGQQDVVIIALKAHQAWEAAEDLKPLLGPETAVVTAQNGVPWWYFHGLDGPYADLRLRSVDPGDRQWNAIGPERVIGCTVYPATEIVEPGVVKHIYGDQFGLGEPNRRESERLTRFADALTAGGLKPRLFSDIRDDIWLKLWGNLCFNPISALTHATLDVVATEPGTRALARSMMLEAQAIGERLGVTFRVDVERRINGAAGVGAHRTSMLQDLDKGRPLEIDALLGAVQEMGRLTETRTPFIDAVLGLVQQMASVKGLYPTFPPEALAGEGAGEPAIERPRQLAAS